LEGASSLGGVGVYMNNGKGEFELASVVPLSPANIMVLADFNHDGLLDIATSFNQLAFGKGKGQFESPVAIWDDPPPLGFVGIAAGDFNNDGWTDLMAVQGEYCCGAYFVMLNNHQGGFNVTTYTTPTGYGPKTFLRSHVLVWKSDYYHGLLVPCRKQFLTISSLYGVK
jgi:hypothetical protein